MVASASMLSIRPCEKLNHRLLFQHHRRRILRSLSLIAILNATRWVHSNSKNNKRAMVSASSSSNSGAFTTLKERVTFAQEIKKSKFIAIAGPLSDQSAANAFLSEVQDPKATHNCWAYKQLGLDSEEAPSSMQNGSFLADNYGVGSTYVSPVDLRKGLIFGPGKVKVGDQFRSNDDGEPSGTAGKPILSAIESSGIDRVMVVVIRHFGGIKLGTGGLVRAYGGVAAECLRNAPTCLVKSKVPMGLEVPYDLLGVVYHQLQSFKVEDIDQDYDTGKDSVIMVTFKVDFDQVQSLEEAIKIWRSLTPIWAAQDFK